VKNVKGEIDPSNLLLLESFLVGKDVFIETDSTIEVNQMMRRLARDSNKEVVMMQRRPTEHPSNLFVVYFHIRMGTFWMPYGEMNEGVRDAFLHLQTKIIQKADVGYFQPVHPVNPQRRYGTVTPFYVLLEKEDATTDPEIIRFNFGEVDNRRIVHHGFFLPEDEINIRLTPGHMIVKDVDEFTRRMEDMTAVVYQMRHATTPLSHGRDVYPLVAKYLH
jgi:hypothetical protein